MQNSRRSFWLGVAVVNAAIILYLIILYFYPSAILWVVR